MAKSKIIIVIAFAHQSHFMQVGSKNVGVFINGSVLDNCLGASLDIQELIQSVIQKVYLEVKTPSWHVFVKIEQVWVMINVFKLGNPFIMLAE